MSFSANLDMVQVLEHLGALSDLKNFEGVKPELYRRKLDKQELEVERKRSYWLDPNRKKLNEELFGSLIESIFRHMKGIIQRKGSDGLSLDDRKALISLMALFSDAAYQVKKLQLFVDIRGGVEGLAAYQRLVQLYRSRIGDAKKEPSDLLNSLKGTVIHQPPIKDLEDVKADRDYELFYLENKQGQHFFSSKLLQQLELFYDVEHSLFKSSTAGILQEIALLEEMCLQRAADMLKDLMRNTQVLYFKKALVYRDHPFISELFKCFMALFLTAAPQGALPRVDGMRHKYYLDFRQYLCNALLAMEAFALDVDFDFSLVCRKVLSELIFCLFTLPISRAREARLLIDVLAYAHVKRVDEFVEVWYRNHDATLRQFFSKTPPGPILMTEQILRHLEIYRGFEPLVEGDLTSKIASLRLGQQPIDCIKMPSPTEQHVIEEAMISPEFNHFIKDCMVKEQKLLLVQLQQRESWKEKARALEVEKLEDRFKNVSVLTLAQAGPFFDQTFAHQEMGNWRDFRDDLLHQIEKGHGSYYISKSFSAGNFLEDFLQCMAFLHSVIFEGKEELSISERQEFILLSEWCIVLLSLKQLKPDALFFICKDGIDRSSMMSFGFILFIKILLSSNELKENEAESLIALLYGPALVNRKRLPWQDLLLKVFSALSSLSTKQNSPLIKPFIDTLGVRALSIEL